MTSLIDRLARRATLALAHRVSVRGDLIVHEGGLVHHIGPGGQQATLEVRSPRAWSMLWTRRGCVEGYVQGLWDSPEVSDVFELAALNIERFDEARRRLRLVRTPWLRVRAGLRRNTPTRSRQDIAQHYDLGNDLFKIMLDPEMMYSCAVFETASSTLDAAALRKLELVCEKLRLGPDDRLVEIGGGWGGFAIYAASTRGCHVTTTTISLEQFELASERVRAAGLQHLIDVRFDDYRELTGKYNKLVSIEMIEAVGYRDFGTYFDKCSRLLTDDGLMLLQAITIDDRAYEVSKLSRSFIQTYIFPNGCLPSRQVIAEQVAKRTDLRTIHLEDFTPQYAETLRRWRSNIQDATAELEALGYDERFRRLWCLYLSYAEAGFEVRRTGLVQMVLAKPGCHFSMPQSDHLDSQTSSQRSTPLDPA